MQRGRAWKRIKRHSWCSNIQIKMQLSNTNPNECARGKLKIPIDKISFFFMHFFGIFVKVSRLFVLICDSFLLFHVENISACVYFIFFGFGPGCQWHFNGKILKWWNGEKYTSNGGREREKKNSERKTNFYDAQKN